MSTADAQTDWRTGPTSIHQLGEPLWRPSFGESRVRLPLVLDDVFTTDVVLTMQQGVRLSLLGDETEAKG